MLVLASLVLLLLWQLSSRTRLAGKVLSPQVLYEWLGNTKGPWT
jgi:hypothetical protein